MEIRNKRDLKIAYALLKDAIELKEMVREKKTKVGLKDFSLAYQYRKSIVALNDKIAGLKRDIRAYQNKPVSTRRIISNDYDGYIVLLPLPEEITDTEEADEWFMENEYLDIRPSQYDCTGQLFTSWYKLFKRGGHFYVYHRVAADV